MIIPSGLKPSTTRRAKAHAPSAYALIRSMVGPSGMSILSSVYWAEEEADRN